MLKIQLRKWVKLFVSKISVICIFLPISAFSQITDCTVSTSGINFGTYTGSPLSMMGQLSISCNYTGNPENLYIGLGPESSQNRAMANGANQLRYNIYQDSAYGRVWSMIPSEVAGPFPCVGTENRPTCQIPALTMYGFMPGGETAVNNENYSQNINIIVSSSPNLGDYINVSHAVIQTNFTNQCSISASPTDLGPYNSFTGLKSIANIGLNCNAVGLYSVTLKSQNAVGNQNGEGLMRSGNNSLNYNIFKPSGNLPNSTCSYSVAWGESPNSANTLQISQPNTMQTYNLCISIPPNQNPPAGTYTDTIIATIFF